MSIAADTEKGSGVRLSIVEPERREIRGDQFIVQDTPEPPQARRLWSYRPPRSRRSEPQRQHGL